MKSNPNNNKMKINVINISNSDKISAQSYCTDNEAGNKDR